MNNTKYVVLAEELLPEDFEVCRLHAEYRHAAKQGDELAAEIVDRHGKCLGKALAQIACVVDPEVFVIGGGVSKAGTIITDTTEKYFKEYAFHACKNTKFTLATLGNDAGMYGGACAIMND